MRNHLISTVGKGIAIYNTAQVLEPLISGFIPSSSGSISSLSNYYLGM
jgi:hypothetical protein